MKTTILTALFFSIWAAAVVPGNVSQGEPVATAFTYQGRLIDANATADGHYDFEFAMYDSPVGGNQLAIPENRGDIDVIDGYFTVELHFGHSVFAGDERWLQIGVRPGELSDPNGYTPLHPRQRVSPVPYALYALSGNEGPPGPPGDSHWISNGADIYYVEGNVGVGTDRPNSRLEAIAIAPTPSIFAFNGGPGPAIVGESVMGDGVAGESIDPNRSGVYGHSVNGVGVSGRSEENNGIVGWTSVADKSGVYGWSEFGYGVTGRSEAVSGRGVFGVATDTNGVGVYGLSANGHAGYFEGDAYFSGNVGIGTTSPQFGLTLDNDGGIIAKGTFGSGTNLATSGDGTRLIWYPKKAAFRAGSIGGGAVGDEWDDKNIGDYSTATGLATTASGAASTAMGYFATATAWTSTAMGYGSSASGLTSTAMGWQTTASGNFSTAIGVLTISSGNNSIVLGEGGPLMADPLVNNIPSSLMIGFKSDIPTLFVGPSSGAGTTGNVGIGTIDPKYALDVKGDIRATGSVYYGGTVGSADGTAYYKPDYVFEEGYHVMSTDQVEDYLKKENHLPWMTSAEQEEREHGSVIDMTRMAFETVETAENLQMQVIQLNKLLKEQGALVRGQQQTIEALEQRLDLLEKDIRQHQPGRAAWVPPTEN